MDNERTTLRVIVCRPNKRAEVAEIDDSFKAMQDLIGGIIESVLFIEINA